jgi:hypothetical protein
MEKKKKFKKAMTLVETIVAITLFMLGIQATILIFSRSWQSRSYSLEMGKASFMVSRSVSDVVQYLRRARQSDAGAFPLVSANDNDIVFYSDYDKDVTTERVHIYLSDGIIYMGIREPSATLPRTYASGDASTVQLAQHIVNTASDPVFSYYNKDYPGDVINNPVDVPADVSQIRLVKIFLKINIDPNKAPENINQESFVEIRNLNDYDRIH